MDNSQILGYSIPAEILEKIFSFVDLNNLLNASLVSHGWFNFIANSPVCMRKIKLSFTTKMINRQHELKDFKRNYLNLYCQGSIVEIQENLGVREWKSIEFFRVNFPSTDEAINFFHMVNDYIEEIKLNKVYIDASYCPNALTRRELTFPKLRALELKNVQNLLYHEIFRNCKALTELSITSGEQSESSLNAAKQLLYANHRMEKLTIVSTVIDEYFKEDMSMLIKFKLKALELRDINNLPEECLANLKKFLCFHMATLKTLDLGDWFGIETANIVFHMPQLKSLTFRIYHDIGSDLMKINFPKNLSITFLHLNEPQLRIEILRAFIEASPNLKELKLFSLNQTGLEYLKEAIPRLEKLFLQFLEATDVSSINYFPHLKEFSMLMYVEGIAASVNSDYNLEKLVALAKCKNK